MEILTLTKLKERGFPFLWSLPNSNALINGNISLMVTPLLWHWYFDFGFIPGIILPYLDGFHVRLTWYIHINYQVVFATS